MKQEVLGSPVRDPELGQFFLINPCLSHGFDDSCIGKATVPWEDHLTLYHTIPTFNDKRPFENIAGKGENAGNQRFLLFPQCFQHYQRQKSSFF